MHKHLKLFFGIVSASPVLFLLGLVISFLLYLKIPAPISQNVLVSNSIVSFGAILILAGTALAFAAQKVSRIVARPSTKATCPDLMRGPYAHSRHPGSLSLIIMYIGFALVVNSWTMLAFAGLMILLLTLVFVPLEEKTIMEFCPEAYTEYKKKVRMWL